MLFVTVHCFKIELTMKIVWNLHRHNKAMAPKIKQ